MVGILLIHAPRENFNDLHLRSDELEIRDRARHASRFVAQKILAIPCRANSTDIAKDLRKVLLGLEATGHGHVQYSRIGSAQHRLSALEPLAQNKLMRGLAR